VEGEAFLSSVPYLSAIGSYAILFTIGAKQKSYPIEDRRGGHPPMWGGT